MEDFILQLIAQLDTSKAIKDYNAFKENLEKEINIKVNLDTSNISKLAEQLQSALSKASNGKINIDTGQITSALEQVVKNSQQSGQKIGNALNQGIESSVKKANNSLKSFSELKIDTGNISAIFDKNGLLDVEQSLNKIKETYSEFGQVKITDKLFDSDGKLQQFKVNIQQINGDLKESRSFMMALSNSGKSFVFPKNIIKGSESFVHHLNDGKKVTNELLTEEQKLANIMANVREKTEQTRQAEEKRQQIAQNNAINKSLEQEYNQRQKIADQLNTKVNKIQLSIETGGYDSKVESLIAKKRQWTDENGNARISTDNLSLALNKLITASNTFSNDKTVTNQQALIKAENELNIEVEKVTNSVRKMNAEFAKDTAISSLHNQIQKFYDNNGAAHRKWGTQLKQMLSETASGAELTKERVTEIKTAFNGVVSAAQQAGKVGKTWFQSLRDATKFLTYWTSPTFITMKAISEAKQVIGTIKALDTALVDLKKTTTMTSSELEQFYYDSNKVAKQMGVTTEEIIKQAAEFSRLGYSSKEAATQMAKYSSWFKTISPGMDIEQAGDTLTSVMKAFKYDVQDVEKIMSMINTVGNNFAVSNADISEILTRSSSAMMEANNSLADTIALGTAATEITRDAASVGIYLPTNIVIC